MYSSEYMYFGKTMYTSCFLYRAEHFFHITSNYSKSMRMQEASQSPTLSWSFTALRPLGRVSPTLRHEAVGIPDHENDRAAMPKSPQGIKNIRRGDDTYLG